ncbi:hypothetical protein F4677DRAFT_439768 [Hypoxylon crocopeplum]|nr:hypothetical protein F4677DRAFT_439768 [Hypoxylon crocopeplum]
MGPLKKHSWMTGPTFSVDDVIDPASPQEETSSAPTATKRKRASKPKVRTGSSKIRRVKCDETKPACTRCTSTGRKCDGYEGSAPPRRRKPPPSLSDPLAAITTSMTMPTDPYLAKRHEIARHSFAAACRGNSSLRVLRPLAADIEGTEQERMFFHRFRQAAEAGLAMHASSLGAGFWRRLVPQVGHSDPAVRHALIALGAAYTCTQLQQEQQEQIHHMTTTSNPGVGIISRSGSPDEQQQQQQQQQHQQPYASTSSSTPPPEDDYHCIDQLELFTIQQYNLSIYHLQRHVQPGSLPESVEVTLICCLIFVCIETSRGNEAAALAHVANGLQIIKALPPDSALIHLPPSNRSGGSSSRSGQNGNSSYAAASTAREQSPSPRISRPDWRQLLDFFLALEPSAATYGLGSQPPTPPSPSVSMWSPPLGNFDEISVAVSQWDTEAIEMEI